ncbi:ankyrin-1-like [Trichogramma pretiosum]|uniref:ankyrin-1-like n=1 Tax=Trichogramma pretiosum TaxID=7493 RepID=UPI0006C986CC|nr:ankyrin-1-like [Trichogramma pretiosum]
MENPPSKLETFRKLRKSVNWEIPHERVNLLYKFDDLIKSWEGQFPDLRDVFKKEEIDRLLIEEYEMVKSMESNPRMHCRPRSSSFIDFVIENGYRGESDVGGDGKPLLHRTTAVHLAAKREYYSLVADLFRVYDRYDLNYFDDMGLTHFHVACMTGCDQVVKRFLEVGQDPNCLDYLTGDSPLHLALKHGHKKVTELLLRNGANPNLANDEGLTPLHFICQNSKKNQFECESEAVELMNLFFTINDERHQPVQVDAKNQLGLTPIQWAVANLLPVAIDVLVDHGADLSEFVVPRASHLFEVSKLHEIDHAMDFKLNLTSCLLAVVGYLEKNGYQLKRSDAATIMTLFAKHKLFENSEHWREEDHLCEKLSRDFFRRWALDSFLKLTRYKLPILCCRLIIDESFKNKDLWYIFLAAKDQSSQCR